ncbi:3-deoxy-D-manno-octulosonate 8-phosphate phosphatase KdsC [Hartmannibacter diazotrophicus]|uniref:3-deoxy-D-manno-octulosonate 8-phosphate phosphatase KdsC n=1 Tax=Hartmannibacter diazotrophicus TaxID=1482074 RepID=A0A2C9D2E5_9HYPH|nr:acylneuraminate cytidylyltransferase [Hartmannibacter diazotrophicus]SON54436.1 3-deoxy-D-manno-octulosonate 8-phosphate phosphatase KdsC [Hartmannibacter diazotrophicus]
MTVVALIPARGGSKSIPRKNIRPIAGRPLIAHAAIAAHEAAGVDEVVIATDDDEIASVVLGLGLERLRVFLRSAETATDTASTESVIDNYLQHESPSSIVLMQCTSPLTTAEDIDGALRRMAEQGADSLVTVARQKRFFWSLADDGSASPVNYDPRHRPRRQEFDGQLVENGAFYIFSAQGYRASGCRLHGRVAAYEMAPETLTEIDEPEDWLVVEKLLTSRQTHSLADRARKIRVVLADVDGVLTDAGMYYSEAGDELKRFNTRDGAGFSFLREAGIVTGIVTRENTRLVARRAEKLKLDIVVQGASDKRRAIEALAGHHLIHLDEIAYIGDDVYDLEALQHVGLSACPADAVPSVRHAVHHVCAARGGEGAVRELADLILAARRTGS